MRTLLLLMPLMVAACAAHGSVPVDSMAAVATISHAMRKSPAPFDRYRTFIFGLDEPPPSGYHAATRTSEERRSLETFVADLLVEKGYALSSGAGDFSITLGSGTREFEVHDMIDDDSLPQGLNTTFVEGAVVAYAFDASTGNLVWHCTTQAQIDPARVDTELLRRSVRALFLSFPSVSDLAR